ncbi:MAG: tRNA (guanosine(46)-N7)-methyltransferase TrmB [Candidatus Ancillula sp.]|nr:tRNA (guanosine(46)-N7)-methyltransferase TrmB [Candidatus Ancillula sp.]
MPERPVRPIRSFVNREGRLSKHLENAWNDMHKEYVSNGLKPLNALFDVQAADNTKQRLVVEIGSGQGNQVVHAAKLEPDTNFVAIEVYKTGVAHTLYLMNTQQVTNVRIIQADAYELFANNYFSAQEPAIDELWTFFPDPWPKKKHKKRRLINENFKALVLQSLVVGGIWRIATDWEDYANSILKIPDITASERFSNRLVTNFEQKAKDANRMVYDFVVQNNL